MEYDVVYQGCKIQPLAWSLCEGGFGAKVVVRRRGEPGGSAHLLVLAGSWRTREDAESHAMDAGKRFVTSQM